MAPPVTFQVSLSLLLTTEDAGGDGGGERVCDQHQCQPPRAGILPAHGEAPAGPRGASAAAPEDPAG